jgi:hypothetical protein
MWSPVFFPVILILSKDFALILHDITEEEW